MQSGHGYASVIGVRYVLEDYRLPNVGVYCYFNLETIRRRLCDVLEDASAIIGVWAIVFTTKIDKNRTKSLG